jgi:hypothetical protein
MTAGLRAIVAIDGDILLGQVTGPDHRMATANADVDADLQLLFLQLPLLQLLLLQLPLLLLHPQRTQVAKLKPSKQKRKNQNHQTKRHILFDIGFLEKREELRARL